MHKKIFSPEKLAKVFLGIFLFIFPLQIQVLLFSEVQHFTGVFQPFTSFFFYAADLCLMVSLMFFSWRFIKKKTETIFEFGSMYVTGLLVFFVLMLILHTFFFAEHKVLALLISLRFLELLGLYFLVINRVLSFMQIFRFLAWGIGFQVLVGLFQYIFQGSLGLSFLGEPILGKNVANVAKVDLNGDKILRAYGTFPHPNIFGGAAFFALVITFTRLKNNFYVWLPWLILFGFGLLISFSRSAFVAVIAFIIFYFALSNFKVRARKVLIVGTLLLSLAIIFNVPNVLMQRFNPRNDSALLSRIENLEISKSMLLANPLGVGLGNYTDKMQNYTLARLEPWDFQPVHNIFLLVTNEIGVLGGLVYASLFFVSLVLLFRYLRLRRGRPKHHALILISLGFGMMIIGLFDHYFFTLFPGQVLWILYFALVSGFLDDEAVFK